ncbi:DUF4097 family beta strand repeat protein [Streptosporangiaceae bacterium NEAU-GS5]|nr:DUF4097 family beta strand repeat protein [Streptosporangiaceae bacterium NEAU-GS5]
MRPLLLGATLLGAGLLVTACDFDHIGQRNHATVSYDVSDGVTLLDTQSGAGDVKVVESDRSGVHVTEKLNWSGDRPENGHRVSGGTLFLKYDCGNCSIDYTVEVPKGMNIKVGTGAGDVRLESLTGPLKINTGSGDVTSSSLEAKQVVAETGAGDVKLNFAAAPDSVTVDTGVGDATVSVPSGEYNVSTHTGAGDEEVGVTRNPASPHVIVVKTGAGDAHVLSA